MKYLIVLSTLLCYYTAKTQNSFDSSFHSYYYDQKLSMFQTMPDLKKETIWMGDSITDGGEWSELFPGLRTNNRGISADNTFGMLHRIGEVTQRKPSKLFLLIGINDIARNIPTAVIIRNYTQLIDSIQQQSPKTKIYVQTLLPTNNAYTQFKNHQNKTVAIDAVNDGLSALCEKRRLVLVDLHAAFSDGEGKLDSRFTNDGLHLTGAGYQHWKQYLLDNKFL